MAGGNIVLVGFMGCGKTSVGRRVAQLAGMRLVDTDELVMEDAGVSIGEIFAEEGEAGFRARESEALRSLAGITGAVVATGGGIVLNAENRRMLRELGVVCWLDAEAGVMFERASRSGKRPLLSAPNPRETFEQLLASRRALYECVADVRVDSGGSDHDAVARRVLEGVARAGGGRREPGP